MNSNSIIYLVALGKLFNCTKCTCEIGIINIIYIIELLWGLNDMDMMLKGLTEPIWNFCWSKVEKFELQLRIRFAMDWNLSNRLKPMTLKMDMIKINKSVTF